MNERIRELDKQAKLWAIDNTNFPISSRIPAGYTEKFAELIVRECMDITKQCSTGNGIHDLFADEIITQHFGVQE